MRALALLLVFLAALPAPARAGAWARGDGEAFLSLKLAASAGEPVYAMDPTFALYGEYGLTPRLTLGASYDKLDPPLSLVKGFARWNLTAPDATWQMAIEAGGGVEFDDTGLGYAKLPFWRTSLAYRMRDLAAFPGQREPGLLSYFDTATGQFTALPAGTEDVPDSYELVPTRYEPTPTRGLAIAALHLGRGLQTPLGNAWLDMRLGADIPFDDRPALLKLDATAGVSVTEQSFVSLEMRTAATRDYTGIRAVPQIGYELRPGLTTTFGAIFDLRNGAPPRVEMGAWIAF